MRTFRRTRLGLALTDVAIAIGVLAVLLAAITSALGAIENGRVSSAERSVETLRGAAINWVSNGRFSYSGITFDAMRSEGLLPPNFAESAANPWGGNYTIAAAGTGNNQITITLTGLPDGGGQALARKFGPRARAASYGSGVFTVTF
jgi:hypothetical protein